MLKKIVFILSILLSAGAVSAASLWNDNSNSPYTSQKNYKVGDTVMVLIIESTSAAQKAGTDTQAQDSLSSSFNHTTERLNNVVAPSNSLSGAGSNTYKGSGATTRTSNVLASVTATVTEILPNKNLSISGIHRVTVNEESQIIKIEGMIKPTDISRWNTIYSYQVANANVSVKGTGTVGEAQAPGLIPRIINWLF